LKRGLLALIAVAMLVIGVNLWQTHGPRDPEPPPTKLAEAPSKKDTDAPRIKPPPKEEPALGTVPSRPPPKDETDPEPPPDRTEPPPKTDATEVARREARRAAAERASQLHQEAASLHEKKDNDAAIAKMRQAVELVPDADYLVGFLGLLELRAGRHEDGLQHCLRAIQLNDKQYWHHLNAACCACQVQELSLAEKHLARALDLGAKEMDEANREWAENQLNDIRGRTYYVLWTLDPKKKPYKDQYGDRCLVPIPATDLPYQTSTYEVRGARSHEVVKEDGNVFLLVEPDGTNPFDLIFKVNVRTYSYKSVLDKLRKEPAPKRAQRASSAVEALISLPISCGGEGEEDVARADDQEKGPQVYLGKSPGIDPNSTIVSATSARLIGKNDVETAQNIVRHTSTNVKYNAKAGSNTAEEVLASGTAHCGGFAVGTTGLFRAAGIAARPVRGFTRTGEDFAPPGHFGSHSWVEVWLGKQWIPVEPQQVMGLGIILGSYIRYHHYGVGDKENPAWGAEAMGGNPVVLPTRRVKGSVMEKGSDKAKEAWIELSPIGGRNPKTGRPFELRKDAAAALIKLRELAKRDKVNLDVLSAFRDWNLQQDMHDHPDKYHIKFADRPEMSTHPQGLGVDFAFLQDPEGAKMSPVYKWLKAHENDEKWLKANGFTHGFPFKQTHARDANHWDYQPD
jgi:transglutaminase-like putative cysteine protease